MDHFFNGTIKALIMLMVRMVDFRGAARVGVVLQGVCLTVEMHHEQVSSEGVSQHLFVQNF